MALTFNDTLGELMQARVKERMDEYKEWLASGTARDYSEYQLRVGWCQGLFEALSILANVQKTLEER
jgi:hypothetical protein